MWLLTLALAALSTTGTLADEVKGKTVESHMTSQWPAMPLLLEMAEFMSDESPANYWTFVDLISHWDVEEYFGLTPAAQYSQALTASGRIISESRSQLLELSLSLHVYAPKLEMFRQLALNRGIARHNESSDVCAGDLVADVNGKIVCEVEDLAEAIKEASAAGGEKPLMYGVDHRYPGGEDHTVGVVLYAEMATSSFTDFHKALLKLVNEGLVDYVLRPFVKRPLGKSVRLSGYGIELAIKNTEYKAQDDTKLEAEDRADGSEQAETSVHGFNFAVLRKQYPDQLEDLAAFKQHIQESSHELAPMKVWQLQHLSMQVAQKVLSAGGPAEQLSALIHTAHNFPRLARGLTQLKVDDKMKREIIKNQNSLQSRHGVLPTDSALFINGQHFDMELTDIFTLLEHIKSEQRLLEGLHNLGLRGEKLQEILNLDTGSEVPAGQSSGSSVAPKYGLDIRDTAIVWLNDIESDSVYRRWPADISDLLRPAYPGMLRQIRKNIHNLVILVNPTSPSTPDLFKTMMGLMGHNAPIRMGLVFDVLADKKVTGEKDAGVAVICAFNYVVQSHDGEEANMKGFSFLEAMYSSFGEGEVTVDGVMKFFSGRYKSETLDDVFGEDSDFDVGRRVASEFVDKGGFKAMPQALMNGIPLESKNLAGEEFEETVLMEVMKNTQAIQMAVYKGQLTNQHNALDYLMAQPNIMPRLNARILSGKSGRFIDMSGTGGETIEDLRDASSTPLEEILTQLSLRDLTAMIDTSCKYISTKAEAALRPLTVWVVGDFDTAKGRQLLLEAIRHTRESNSVRMCAIHNRETSAPGATKTTLVSRVIQVAHATLPSPSARQLIVKVLEAVHASKSLDVTAIAKLAATVKHVDVEALVARVGALTGDVFLAHQSWAARVAGLQNGGRAVLANGRLLGPLEEGESFQLEDFALLEKFMASTLTDRIAEVVKDTAEDTTQQSRMIMRVSGVLQQTSPSAKPRTPVTLKSTSLSSFTLPPRNPDLPAVSLVAACDPVSGAAQRMAPLLQLLHEALNAEVTVLLNAREKHSEMPLKSFYRMVVQARPEFDAVGVARPGPSAVFTALPEAAILTQALHAPENWLAEVVRGRHDLDNIKLGDVEGSGVSSEYELANLLVEGHCFEHTSGNPPRGLQFTLATPQEQTKVDTTVMANLGYFQLKANPGAWLLELREGRSREMYGVVSHEGTDTPGGGAPTVLLSSFQSQVVKVRVNKLPGMQDKDLLSEEGEDSSGGLWNTITSTFGGEDNSVATQADETVNIFSVASGHLYERFLRIMMVSVRKHTKSPVKFWFLKNFLSPTLKNSLPLLAEHYGFSYELVQYKWPRWLHQQTEKQRIIWGYKILFLDVLFPLDVKKIIFVDADQVVRADIKELHDLDLDGAPYGFVPFCDSRKEMEGFRFWKHGYWRNHLGNRKYHISALFVVDLKKFRRIAAGDRLRGQYQGLSQDPNSLSNLDQDLPNNMIHQVRIKSLPMDWLWCETWCDDDSKRTAKVIDVCNNPQTKEAKLVAADRIIGEWSDYDEDIKAVMARHRTQQREEQRRKEEL